jgi:hypothetical protein
MITNRAANQNGPSQLPQKPPAQTPSEFAAAVVEQVNEVNGRLQNLAYRLYGEETGKEPASGPQPEMSLENRIQCAHAGLVEALSRLDAIQNRL